jgi:hypothetical protein
MGLLLSKLYSLYEGFASGGIPARMLLLGLDAAGKSDAAVMVNYCLD